MGVSGGPARLVGGGAKVSLPRSPGPVPGRKGRGLGGRAAEALAARVPAGTGMGHTVLQPRGEGVHGGALSQVQAPHHPPRPGRKEGGAGELGGGSARRFLQAGPALHAHLPWPRRHSSLGEGSPLPPSRPRRKGAQEPGGPESGGPATRGPGSGRRAEPGSPAPATPSRAGGRAGPHPAQPALGGPRGPGTRLPPAGPRRHSPARPASLRPLGPRWAAHAAGEASAPRPRPGRLRPAAPRAFAAASCPRASGRAPAGISRRRGGGGARAGGRGLRLRAGGWTALGAPLPARPSGRCARARPAAAHSLTRRRCASVRPRGERRRAGQGRLRRKDPAAWAPARAQPALPAVPVPRARLAGTPRAQDSHRQPGLPGPCRVHRGKEQICGHCHSIAEITRIRATMFYRSKRTKLGEQTALGATGSRDAAGELDGSRDLEVGQLSATDPT